jgi:hypothetical protein
MAQIPPRLPAGVQRVTHAAEKQGEPINWNDARRVVTQTLILIYELDNLLSH